MNWAVPFFASMGYCVTADVDQPNASIFSLPQIFSSTLHGKNHERAIKDAWTNSTEWLEISRARFYKITFFPMLLADACIKYQIKRTSINSALSISLEQFVSVRGDKLEWTNQMTSFKADVIREIVKS